MDFSDALGLASVRRARRAIEGLARSDDGGEESFPEWHERGGVFVTLRTYPAAELRGCVGFPRPILPLGRAIDEAAVAAAQEDPRFSPVTRPEMDRLVVEVSLLSVPEAIVSADAAGRRAAVVVGRDGLIVSTSAGSGLLLPQVAVEEGWDAEEFLARTCEKAGVDPGAWRRAGTTVERFEATVFAEVAPRAAVGREGGGGSAEAPPRSRRPGPSAR